MKTMKLFISFIIVLINLCNCDHDNFINDNMDIVLTYKYGSGFGGTEDDNCMKECCKNPPNDVTSILSEVLRIFSENPMGLKSILYDKEKLTTVCRYVGATSDCARRCPETQRKALLKKALAPAIYICQNPYFVNSSTCYNEVLKEMKDVCNSSEKCGQMRSEFYTQFTAYNEASIDSQDLNETQKLLTVNFCKYLDCRLDCNNEKRIAKCGREETKALRNFFVQFVKTVKEIIAQYSATLPKECDHIGHDD